MNRKQLNHIGHGGSIRLGTNSDNPIVPSPNPIEPIDPTAKEMEYLEAEQIGGRWWSARKAKRLEELKKRQKENPRL